MTEYSSAIKKNEMLIDPKRCPLPVNIISPTHN